MPMAGIAVFLLALIVPIHTFAGSDGKVATPVGSASPRIEAADLSGDRISSEAVLGAGKAIVLNFWGLRCSACIMEIPHVNALNDRYAGRIQVLGINVDGIGGDVLSAQMRKMKLDIKYAVVPDPDFKLVDLFGMTAAPLTVVIDAGGTVRYRHEGYEPGDEAGIEEALKSALEGKKASNR